MRGRGILPYKMMGVDRRTFSGPEFLDCRKMTEYDMSSFKIGSLLHEYERHPQNEILDFFF